VPERIKNDKSTKNRRLPEDLPFFGEFLVLKKLINLKRKEKGKWKGKGKLYGGKPSNVNYAYGNGF
jgi:hypothetical protein